MKAANRLTTSCGIEDLANQVRHSLEYKDACAAKGLQPGRFIGVKAGEYLSGLPAGWTCPRSGAVSLNQVNALHPQGQAGVLSCCSLWVCVCVCVRACFVGGPQQAEMHQLVQWCGWP